LSDEIAVVEIRKTRRCVMAKRRGSMIERILKRVEDHVEEYRAQERVREAELQAHRTELWAEAAERQRLLAEALAEGEADRASLEEITKEERVVFVLHREALTGTLEDFAGEKDCLVNVVPGKGNYGGGRGIEGLRGSWLVFEASR
jgi:regulator of protease activity HflC (stomatin/prohibitin superfamily)